MIAWLRVYIDTHCAKMPNSDILMMPARTTIPELYNHYLQDRPEGSRPPLKLSTMYSVLDEHFPKVHYPRVTGLGKCLQCFNLKAAVEKARKGSSAELQDQLQKLHAHHTAIAAERAAYCVRIQESRIHSNRILSLAADGASPLQFPWILNGPRALVGHSIPILLYGTLCHTFNDNKQLYYSPPFYTHEPNYVITVLAYRIITILAQNPTFDPVKLYLQVDNTSRENKNVYIIFFLAVLILLGYFDDVVVHFLTVGHTHDDQDQVFGMLASQKKTTHRLAHDMPSLIRSMANPHAHKNNKPLFAESVWVNLRGVYDWKTWMAQHLPELSGHSQFRSLHLHRCPDGVRLNYRTTADPDQPWSCSFEPPRRDGDRQAPLVAIAVPPGMPLPLPPRHKENVNLADEVDVITRAIALSLETTAWLNSFRHANLHIGPPPSPPPCISVAL